jgi:hypothetical protein
MTIAIAKNCLPGRTSNTFGTRSLMHWGALSCQKVARNDSIQQAVQFALVFRRQWVAFAQ